MLFDQLTLKLGRQGPRLGGSSNSLLNGLVAYWKLDEAANVTRVDSSGGGYHLLDINSNVGIASGKISTNAAHTVAFPPRQVLSTLNQVITDGCTVTIWFKNSQPAVHGIFMFNTVDNDAYDNGIDLYTLTGGTVAIDFYNAGPSVALTKLGVNDTNYHFVVVTVNGSAVSLTVDNGIPVTDTFTPGLGPYVNVLGFYGSGTGPSAANTDATVSELGIWSRALIAGEQAALYNAGVGLTYPF
jgi:hypothetical protein